MRHPMAAIKFVNDRLKLHNCSMEDWDDYRYFLAVVREGSIAAAAQLLRVNDTTVSRRISALEAALDTRLFDRRRTGFVPTAEAASLIPAAEEIEAGAKRIARLTLAQDRRLEGPLRVTAPLVLLRYVLMPIAAQFAARYPGITLHLQGADEISNLINREADVAIRVTAAPMDTLHGYRICDAVSGLYAAPALLARCGLDAASALSAQDLEWIAQEDDGARGTWQGRFFPAGRQVCHCDNKVTAIGAALQGMGVVELPVLIGDAEPGLERLPGFTATSDKGIWVLYHRDLRNTARVRAFVDMVRSAPTLG